MRENHNIPPVYDEYSRILILGSFPSVRSREEAFFYAHPRNRFWKVISSICQEEVPETVEEKKELLLKHRIALWDVIGSCEIRGSSDASIRNVETNDIRGLMEKTKIEAVFCNGRRSYELYYRYLYPQTGKEAVLLPSTSPANASMTLEDLRTVWEKTIGMYHSE